MALQAWHFLVRRRDTQRLIGHALVCPGVRYASTRLFGIDRLWRGFAGFSQWQAIARELEAGWDGGYVPSASTVTRCLLARDLGVVHALQFAMTTSIEDEGGPSEMLDGYLRRQEGW